MATKLVLFDLDGTLLPMDQDQFLHAYFSALAKKMVGHSYDPKKLMDSIWAGTAAMIKNRGKKTNEEVFWDSFCGFFGPQARADEPIFDEFYRREFQALQQLCPCDHRSAQVIAALREKNIPVALATNPLFPAVATHSRVRWAGLQPEDFRLITTYENSNYCKPNLDYYRQILAKLEVAPEDCVMVGNDVSEDMVAQALGMRVFLLTPCLINKSGKDITQFPHGDFDALLDFIQQI